MGALGQAMRATLRSYWSQAAGYQKFLYIVGFLLLASAVFHTGVLLVTGGSLQGDVSWRKPILFGEAFGLTAVSIAWVMSFLPHWRAVGWLLLVPLGLANLGEVFLVALQQWRGVPSHFNNSTPFDTAVFLAMGFLIVLAGIVIGVVALLSLFALRAPASLAWGIRSGLLLLVASQVFGGFMIRHGGNTLGAAGALKIPHALALHGLQALPVLAWLLLFAQWEKARRTRLVLLGAVGYALLVAVSAFQAFSGLALFDLSLATALLLGLGAAFFGGACVRALLALQRRPGPGEGAPA